jgi:NAD(P)-dependent dehydrogenase (short-subunit alcohol dehydrogenase family)
MSKVAVVTGGGSGVGRAVAVELVRQGWRVAVMGRTEAHLAETVRLASGSEQTMLACVGDVGREADVAAMAARVTERLGDPVVLVNSAGANVPRRALGELSTDDFRRLIDINLTGAFLCTNALLPAMQRQGRGTIVNIISDAGLIANAVAGPAYVASKFGLTGLTQSINVEQRKNNIRATAIFPGEINTPLLDKRPVPPPQEKRLQMLQPDDVAACVMLAINLPDRAIVEQLLVRPRRA